MKRRFHRGLIAAAAFGLSACGSSSAPPASVDNAAAGARPNVLVILADDVGYSDISAFGREIQTPNLDALARAGQVLTNFPSTPLCATSSVRPLIGPDHPLDIGGACGRPRVVHSVKISVVTEHVNHKSAHRTDQT